MLHKSERLAIIAMVFGIAICSGVIVWSICKLMPRAYGVF